MSPQVEEILFQRARLLHNLDKIVGAGHKNAKKAVGQMSLFSEDESYSEVILEDPPNFNPYAIANMEANVLGIPLLYSEYEKYETVRCRYCNCTLPEVFGVQFEGNKTFLAKLIEVEYKTSGTGNAYAKLKFSSEGTEARMYLFGDLYKKHIRSCFVDRIYLVTSTYNEERNSLDLVNFMQADDIANITIRDVWVTCSLKKLLILKTYIFMHMKGDQHNVNVKISDNGLVFMNQYTCNIDNENLVELKKEGIIIKLT